MRRESPSRSLFFVPSFAPLRASIWAVLGLTTAACGGNVTVEAGGAGGDGGSGGSTSTLTPTGPSSVCAGAVPLPQANGTYSGYDKCPDGTIHRVSAVACESSVPACLLNEVNIFCKSDADCTAAPNGKCAHVEYTDFGGGADTYCDCVYPCTDDSDCSAGQACICPGVVPTDRPWAQCSASECRTNDDCASGECGVSSYNDGCGWVTNLVCRDDTDICRVAADCEDGTECVAPYGDTTWSCQGAGCAIGRPFTVDGEIRTAPRARRADWSDASIAPDLARVPDAIRPALAAYFRDMAALEHASIASFARFSLELLALGAPPDLLMASQQAAADEIAHARIAFALASAYEGKAIGPAPLDVSGVKPATSIASIVSALVEEACVGETLGAAEARALAGFVDDPALAAAYDRIAEDEGRHAELGWSTLAWLLRGATRDLRRIASDAFDRAVARMSVDPQLSYEVVAPEHGLLSPAMLGALRRQALREIVEPCARALLDSDGPDSALSPRS
ncbi:MAG: ferritin-like domain-containing protein [Polyangiaceae bacterium]